jgi:hypothetical protein
VVPLVFKTSLGAVRSPEGSTPSLLRHNRRELLLRYGAFPQTVFSGARKYSVTTVGRIFGIRCRVNASGVVSTIARSTITAFGFGPSKSDVACQLGAVDVRGRRGSTSPRVNTRRMEPRLGCMDGVNRFADDLEENR